ncbi:phytanoyl-CoA hydroxylase [Massilia sp. UYP11]|uniref:phytanoyl-CoA dioxygenase family protein n=1 Tax=Massilia sp. UYP11 TaxID=1756385 RepID=UPI003D19AB17
MLSTDQLLDLTLQYNTQGFVHLKQLLPQAVVAAARSAFDAAAARHAQATRQARDSGKRFHDLPAILDADPVFVDLVDLPALFPLLRRTVGEDIALQETSARLFFPGPTFTSPYHSDIARVSGVAPAHAPSFLAKAHFYLEDLAPNQGCLSFIPGSQHLPPLHVNPHRPTLAASGATVRIVPRAGDVVLFNTHVLHMAEANDTDRVRKSLIYTYGHFWMKAFRSAAPSDLARFDGDPQRQQLFGVDLPGVSHFGRRLDRLTPPGMAIRLRRLSEKLLHRLLPADSLPPRA